MKASKGKQFVSCAKCGQCFYHRRLMKEHVCPMTSDQIKPSDKDGGYHFSCIDDDEACDIVVGSCPKCRLSFTDEFRYQYHKEHCLMEGKTGFRHVQLVTYDKEENPMLRGEELDEEAEANHIKNRRVMYADFESSIDKDTGEHTFMSYGIYDWQSDTFERGFTMEDFFKFFLRIAYENDEEDVYIYFHNAMNYDANFILRYVLKNPEYDEWNIQTIMKSSNRLQKLVFYTKNEEGEKRNIHIADTFLFLTLSLEAIVGSVRKDDIIENKHTFERFFHIFKEYYPYVDEKEIDHILRKNIFPYKFFTSEEKLDTPIGEFLSIFEPKEENLPFFSERVTVEDLEKGYEDTKHVMDVFHCKDARDYHDIYLMCDVMQLADLFERAMNILWESHHIHLTKYIGMPSATWAAFLRHDPSLSIPLYRDTFFAEFFKGMVRGGITSAALRHAVADEKHSIIYLDVNGLYPYVMQAYDFPCGSFSYIDLQWEGVEYCKAKLEEYFAAFERERRGMCFCVDLHIPNEVKKKTDMYPFAPEHRKIFNEYFDDPSTKKLTPFLERWQLANKEDEECGMGEFKGLVCTLYDKEKYNVHWRLLKFYLEHGVEVKKVHFGISFKEDSYLADYVRKNIAIRNTRSDILGKTLYKLLGNALYGKTFESPFKRAVYLIIRSITQLQGLMEDGVISSITPIEDIGWVVRMDGEDIILDKPTYIGACVCEFSKLHMYQLLYDKMMKIFPDGCQMVYTDTDSFILYVTHPEGVSGKPEDLFAYIKAKDPTLIGGIGGQVKSETGEDDTIAEVIALRSKVYAYRTKNGHIGKRAKGTTHDAQEMQLDWEAYYKALTTLRTIRTDNIQFEREKFKIATVHKLRKSLSVNDGKRKVEADGIHTHAFGYEEE